MRKRSSSASLVLMSTVPFLLAACSSDTPPPAPKPVPKPTTAYETVEDCAFDGRPRSVCESALATAKAEAAKSAPRFKTLEECQKEFDNCQVAPVVAAAAPAAGAAPAPTVVQAGGGDSFTPALMGFMVGQALSGGSSGGSYAAGFNSGAASERERNNSYAGGGGGSSTALYRARGGQLSQVSAAADGRVSATPVRARTLTSAQVAQTKVAQAKAAQARAAQARASASNRSVSRSGFGGRSGGFGG
jgi:hypothetical protein